MGTPIDNLRRGDYFVVSLLEGEYTDRRGNPIVTGEPLRFLAMGLPFISARGVDGRNLAIDTRIVELQRVPIGYARAFMKPKKRKAKIRSPRPLAYPPTHPMCDCGPIQLDHPNCCGKLKEDDPYLKTYCGVCHTQLIKLDVKDADVFKCPKCSWEISFLK